MNEGNMSVVHIGAGKDTLDKCPKPPMHLSATAKKGYLMMGNFLAQAERLRNIYLPTLEIWASAYEQWQCACSEINRKNKEKALSGFIQKFSTGATNITTEMVVRNDAAKTMLMCAKQFGLDPKSEKELKAQIDTGQLDLFEQYKQGKYS